MKKICVITGTRADFGLLYWLLKGVQTSQLLNLQLIVTGSHLSTRHGYTIDEIIKAGFEIDIKIENLSNSDTPVAVSKATASALIGLSQAYVSLKPDLIVILGDRFEMLAAASAALIADIPILHIHGGELTEGAYDDAIRHSITKMATWHCVATKEYRNRVIQLGETPERVVEVGGLGLDNIFRLNLLSLAQLEQQINFMLNNSLLVTYHPVTHDGEQDKGMENLLAVLEKNENLRIIFTLPNADVASQSIITSINDFNSKHANRSIVFKSMGQINYLSAMKYAKAVVGNSSSGIIEAPSFKTPTINIGNRQQGRIKASSIIDCGTTLGSISTAIDILDSEDFKKTLLTVNNPYGNGGASDKILNLIENIDNYKLTKTFHDIAI